MKSSKILKVLRKQSIYLNYVFLIFLVFQSCSKSDEPELVTYTGQVLLYDGPEIGEYDEIDDRAYLKPFPGIEVTIAACKPFSGILGGGCTPNYDVEEMDLTDAEGKYSISFTRDGNISYYPQFDYERSDYDMRGGAYSPNPYKEIILVPRNLIKY